MSKIDRDQLLKLRQDNIGRLFQRAARMYSELALEKLQAAGHEGLTLFHTALISNLDVEGTRIVTLAERAGVTKQAMGQVVAELEERGYIVKTPDPDDKRAVLIQFTERGYQFLEDAYHIKVEIESEFAVKLGEESYRRLRDLLDALVSQSVGD